MQPLFRSRRDRLDRLRRQREQAVEAAAKRSDLPSGGSQTCPGCGRECQNQELVKTEYVCPHCGYHLPIGAYLRLSLLLDPFTFQELWPELTAPNALEFPGYEGKLTAQREKTALSDAAVAAVGKLDGRQAVFAVLDSRFFMGSMGVAVGEKITRAVEYAQKHKLPLIIFSASGAPGCRRESSPLCRWPRPALPLSASLRRAGCTSPCSPTPPPAASLPALPLWAISLWLNPGHSLALPVPGSSSRPSARSCPRASSAPSIWRSTALWTRSSPAVRCARPSPSC